MKKQLLYAALFSFFCLTSFSAHKYYVSLTKVELVASSAQAKIHSQLFLDDFEKLLKERFDLEVKDFEPKNEVLEQTIKKYAEAKITLKCNRSPINLTYLGYEVEGEHIYLYLEGKLPTENIGRVDVENSMLQEIFSEQQNKIDINYQGQVKSIYLNQGLPSGTIYF